MICDSPALAALDVELAGMFANMTGQPQVNAAALRGEEDQWSAAMRQRCADPACIRSAYVARIAQLKRRSLRAKGPAAFAETQPFPAPPDVAAEARRYVYRSCAGFFADRSRIVGFKPPEDFAMSACVTPMWSLGQAGCAVRPIFFDDYAGERASHLPDRGRPAPAAQGAE